MSQASNLTLAQSPAAAVAQAAKQLQASEMITTVCAAREVVRALWCAAGAAEPKLNGQAGTEARSMRVPGGEPAASDLLDIDSVFAMDEASDLR